MASGGPHDLASAVLRVNEYYCFGRQGLRRISLSGGEVAPKDICRVGAWLGGKRAAEKIYAPARVTRRITGVSAELRGAEVPRSTPPRRKEPVVVLGIEGPDVEVLDAVPFVHVVQRSALAQGPAQEAAGVSAGASASAGTDPLRPRRPARRVEAGRLFRSAPVTDPDSWTRCHTGTTDADPRCRDDRSADVRMACGCSR